MRNVLEYLEKSACLKSGENTILDAVEEISYKNGWIDRDRLIEEANSYGNSSYGKHLMQVANGKILH